MCSLSAWRKACCRTAPSIEEGGANADTAIEEERRLAYVGITRGKNARLSYAFAGKRYGEVMTCEPTAS